MDLRRDRLDAALTRLRSVVPSSAPATAVAVRLVAASVGAWLVLRASWSASGLDDPSRRWAVVAVVALWVALAWALPASRRLLPRPGDVPLLLAAALLATFLCVPETDQVLLVAFVVTVLVVGEGVANRRAPLLVVGLVATYVMWVGVFGATGRQSALVGTLVAWWPFLLLPLLAAWRPALATSSTWTRGLVVTIGAVASLTVSRTGALEPTVAPALVATGIALPVSLALAAAVVVVATRDRQAGGEPNVAPHPGG